MKRLVSILTLILCGAFLSVSCASSVSAADEKIPDYLKQAQEAVDLAAIGVQSLPELNDDLLIARNSLRNAEAEYKKNLGWTGKLDTKAEPTVRYLADTARLQGEILLARIGAFEQKKMKARTERLIAATKAKIKIFDDLVAQVRDLKKQVADQASQISGLNAKVASLNAELGAKGSAISSSDQKTAELQKALDEQKKATASSEQRATALSKELDAIRQQAARLQAGSEQLAAEKRIKEFEAAVGKLGGIVKSSPAGLTVTFPRAHLLKTTGKGTTLTTEGDRQVTELSGLLKSYPEYRIKLRVHGFGQPARSEDAAATDQMARFMRERLLEKGNLNQDDVEALGLGAAEPAFPKSNVEGNRRVEIMFVKK